MDTKKPTEQRVRPIPGPVCKDECQHCGGSGWIGDIKCPACS